MPKLAIIHFLDGTDGPVDPSYGINLGGRPDNSLPNYGRPDNSLPGGGHIATLPVFPFDPTIDNSLPDSGHISTGPIVPGRKFVVKWLACTGLILVPDNDLPETATPK